MNPKNPEQKEALNLEFKKATEGDVDAFIELEKTAEGDPKYCAETDRESALKFLRENEVFFIYSNNQLVGNTSYQIKSPDEVYISGVLVRPEFQNKGIARQAALFRLDQIKEYKNLWLYTHPDNVKIISLYESLGFRNVERVENCFGDGKPRVKLVRKDETKNI